MRSICRTRNMLFLVLLMGFVMGMGLFSPQRAHAATQYEDGSTYPQFVIDAADSYCRWGQAHGGQTSAQVTWLSLAGNPAALSTQKSPGQNTVDLQFNMMVARCNYNIPTGIWGSYFKSVCGSYTVNIPNTPQCALVPGATQISGLTSTAGSVKQVFVTSPTQTGPLYARDAIVFTVDISSINQTSSINVSGISHQFSWNLNNTFPCIVAPGAPGKTIPSVNNVDDCPDAPYALNFTIDVPTQAPTLTVTSTCTGFDFQSSGQSIDVAGPGGTIQSGIAPNGSVNLVGKIVPNQDVVDVTAIGGGATSGNTTKSQQWQPPSSCQQDYSLTPTSNNPVLNPDVEVPTSANFSGTVIVDSTSVANKVKNVTVTGTFFKIKTDGSQVPISPSPVVINGVDVSRNSSYTFTKNGVAVSATAGEQICMTLMVDPGSGRVDLGSNRIIDGPRKTSSPPSCVTIGNHPVVTFNAGDVATGSGFGTQLGSGDCSLIRKNNSASIQAYNKLTSPTFYGAGVEFAAFATASITGFESGLGAGTGALSTTVPELSFANNNNGLSNNKTTDAGGNFGSNTGRCTDYFGAASADTTNTVTIGTVNLSALFGGAAGDIAIATGQKFVKVVSGDLIVDRNVKFSTTAVAVSTSLPSLWVVVKGNIYIKPSVTQLDGVYIAQPLSQAADGTVTGGSIDTCYDTPAIPTAQLYDKCGGTAATGLTFSGAVVANKVYFHRTRGRLADISSKADLKNTAKIAEVFNFLPSTYLNPPSFLINNSSSSSSGTYDYYTTLPPVL